MYFFYFSGKLSSLFIEATKKFSTEHGSGKVRREKRLFSEYCPLPPLYESPCLYVCPSHFFSDSNFLQLNILQILIIYL